MNNFNIELKSGFAANAEIEVIVTHNESGKNSVVVIDPKFNSRRLSFKIEGKVLDELTEWVDAITGDPELIKVYYDTGHTIASGSLNFASVQDRPFEFTFCTFGSEYDVSREKPKGPKGKPPIQNMFLKSDDSLFKWIFKDGISQLGLQELTKGFCWLYCDDGSGEVADFIHVYKPPVGIAKITLIHAKGANSNKKNRYVSPGAYELVIAQAMKNLRRMIAFDLVQEIRKSVSVHGNERVWNELWREDLKSASTVKNELLSALDSIGTNCKYEAIIVQPHVLKSKYFNKKGEACTTTGAKQLRSLLFGAQAMAHSASASFRVVADDR